MSVPKIIYGTAWKKERTTDLVVKAVLAGFRSIDTACQPKHYREDLVGNALDILYDHHSIKREDLFLQTKFTSVGGQDRSKPLPYDPAAPIRDQILASFQVSLTNLRTTYLDSYILHSPMETIGKTVEAWKTLMQLQDSKRVRLIGISNTYEVGVLEALCDLRKVDVVQNRWYEGNNWDSDVCSYCLDHGILYQSFWTLTGSPSLLNHPRLVELAKASSCTPAQAVYHLAQVRGIVPLAGSTNEERMKHGIDADKVKFDASQRSLDTLNELNKLIGGT